MVEGICALRIAIVCNASEIIVESRDPVFWGRVVQPGGWGRRESDSRPSTSRFPLLFPRISAKIAVLGHCGCT